MTQSPGVRTVTVSSRRGRASSPKSPGSATPISHSLPPSKPRHCITRRCRVIRLKQSPTCRKCTIHNRDSPLLSTSFGRRLRVVTGVDTLPAGAQRRANWPYDANASAVRFRTSSMCTDCVAASFMFAFDIRLSVGPVISHANVQSSCPAIPLTAMPPHNGVSENAMLASATFKSDIPARAASSSSSAVARRPRRSRRHTPSSMGEPFDSQSRADRSRRRRLHDWRPTTLQGVRALFGELFPLTPVVCRATATVTLFCGPSGRDDFQAIANDAEELIST